MKGKEFFEIRKKLGLTADEFAQHLGYRGNRRNNKVLMSRYEKDSRQIPLTVASLAWLMGQYFEIAAALPDWPEWEGYEEELRPLKEDDDPAGGPPEPDESEPT